MSSYTPEQLARLHEIEIDILKEIERVCEVLGIQYFADWGTLLGAARHKGFIPWDDDIDVGMTRKDYNIFISEAPKLLKKGYTLQHYSVDPNTPTYPAKIRKDGTLFVEEYVRNLPIHQGVFVDIFPYDNIVENHTERVIYEKKAHFASMLYISKCVKQATYEKNKVKRFFFSVLRKGIHLVLIPFSKKSIYNFVDNRMQKYNDTETGFVHCCAYMSQRYSDIFPLIKMKFENIEIYAPRNWDTVLKREYGDYMKMPPLNKRYTHSPYELDLGDRKKRKVLMLVPNLRSANGVASFAMNYFRELDPADVQMDFVVFFEGSSPYFEELRKAGSKIYIMPKVYNLKEHMKKCNDILNTGHYDIIHDNTLHVSLPLMYCAKKHGVLVRILHSHNSKLGETTVKEIRNRAFLPLLRSLATDYTACSDLAGKALFHNRKYKYIPNVIDVNKYRYAENRREDIRKEFNAESKYIIGTVGRLERQKNPIFAIDVFEQFLKKVPDSEYWWIGSGSLENR